MSEKYLVVELKLDEDDNLEAEKIAIFYDQVLAYDFLKYMKSNLATKLKIFEI